MTTGRTVLQHAVSDSTRWDNFIHRPGDVYVCAPPKCGTTWVQTIVASLIFPDNDLPGPIMWFAPGLDDTFDPLDEILARLEAQEHRRMVKSHLPVDALPWFETGRYISVYRDGRDAFISWMNHVLSFRPDLLERLNAEAEAKGWAPLPEIEPDVHAMFARWITLPMPLVMVRDWWERRHASNVLLVHYNDLKVDLDQEMRRISRFLDIPINASTWADQVERCTFDAMKARADEIGEFDRWFRGGGDSFLHRGVNGRWQTLLTPEELARYQGVVENLLDDDVAAWLERGSLDLGWRPEEV